MKNELSNMVISEKLFWALILKYSFVWLSWWVAETEKSLTTNNNQSSSERVFSPPPLDLSVGETHVWRGYHHERTEYIHLDHPYSMYHVVSTLSLHSGFLILVTLQVTP